MSIIRESKYPEGPKSCRLTPAQASIWNSSTVRAALDSMNFPGNDPGRWELPGGRSIDTTLCKKLLFIFIDQDIEANDDFFEEDEIHRIKILIEEMRANGEI